MFWGSNFYHMLWRFRTSIVKDNVLYVLLLHVKIVYHIMIYIVDCCCRRRKMTRYMMGWYLSMYFQELRIFNYKNGYDWTELAENTLLDVSNFHLRAMYFCCWNANEQVRVSDGRNEGECKTNVKTKVIPGKK